MIKMIIDILALDDFYGVGESVDIAKGINRIPRSLKDTLDISKRKSKAKKYRNGKKSS
jgi:hypothetical protein